MTSDKKITALIITYAPNIDILSACVKSLRVQNPKPSILIFDNYSETDPDHDTALSFIDDDCRVITYEENLGFGGAINKSLKSIDTEFVLISNFDIVYEKDFLASALGRLESSGDDVVGITGKTLFYPPEADESWPGRGPDDPKYASGRGTGGVIDNTGTLVNGLMLAYNRGVGQIDIGQFDESDRPMGACFAAFLVRRDAFRPISRGGIGLLDAPYFLYYEDIDWCYRANILGYKILYEPKAVAWHHHSLTTRDKPVFFKYHLIQRNLYRTIMKNMRFRTVIRLWALHARLHIRRARVEKEFGTVTARILLETLAWTVIGLFKRLSIQSWRKVSDTEIVDLSVGEEGHLDDITLRPRVEVTNPLASLMRLQGLYPDDPACRLISILENLKEKIDTDTAEETIRLANDVCPAIVPLLRQIFATRTTK